MRSHKEVASDWAEELSERLGRPTELIRSTGLFAEDFSPSRRVEIRFEDGSFMSFKFAFAIGSKSRGKVAVFTEHCGYLEFPLVRGFGLYVTEVNEENWFDHE